MAKINKTNLIPKSEGKIRKKGNPYSLLGLKTSTATMEINVEKSKKLAIMTQLYHSLAYMTRT